MSPPKQRGLTLFHNLIIESVICIFKHQNGKLGVHVHDAAEITPQFYRQRATGKNRVEMWGPCL